MYRVADDMVRLEYIAEMKISSYTEDDIEYMKVLLNYPRELIAEGAGLALYASTKYLLAAIAAEYQKCCMMEPISVEIPKEVRLLFYNYSRKMLPSIFIEYKVGDIEQFFSRKLSILYSRIIKEKLGISV